jgi:hypothetical protein
MHSAMFYLLGIGAFMMAAGGVIAFVALRNAPEGYEDEEGFVGVTKGDELLLKQFAKEHQYSALHGSADMAA